MPPGKGEVRLYPHMTFRREASGASPWVGPKQARTLPSKRSAAAIAGPTPPLNSPGSQRRAEVVCVMTSAHFLCPGWWVVVKNAQALRHKLKN